MRLNAFPRLFLDYFGYSNGIKELGGGISSLSDSFRPILYLTERNSK